MKRFIYIFLAIMSIVLEIFIAYYFNKNHSEYPHGMYITMSGFVLTGLTVVFVAKSLK